MIYTTAWTGQGLASAAEYQRWLESLTDGDEVLFQQFHPAHGDNAALNSPHEMWQFQRVRLYGDRVHSRGDSYPIVRATGKVCWWGSQDEWGEVFPARIVPLNNRLPAMDDGESVWAHHPSYEPFFFGHYRHHAIARYGPIFGERFRHEFERYYWRDVEGGALLTWFDGTRPIDLVVAGPLEYLYSEFLKG